NGLKALLKCVSLPGFRKTFDAIRDFSNNRLRNEDLGAANGPQAFDDRRLSFHQSGNCIGIQNVFQNFSAAFERRALRTSRTNASTAARSSPSASANRSKKPGVQSDFSLTSRSNARIIIWFRLIRRAFALLSIASSKASGRCTLVGMTIFTTI